MSDERKQAFALEDDDSELVANDNDVFEFAEGDDDDDDDQPTNHVKIEDTQWIEELRLALERGCDLGSIRSIGKCRPLNKDLRLTVWKTCLDLQENNAAEEYIDSDVFDLPEQTLLREDALRLVRTSSINQDLAASKMSDIEAVLTFYCKKHNESYEKGNGWIDLMKPLMNLAYQDRSELYALFSTIRHRYIPRNCEANGMPYHLFRLLLLYHDPELCSFFDTRKITPDQYAHAWIRSLYAGSCSPEVILHLWDGYFQHADQFFVFFLALVLLMFAKEQMLTMANDDKNDIIAFLSKAPSNLTADDLEDFCTLANHYASNTPQSFRKEFYACLFNETDQSISEKACSIYEALCLSVSVQELLQANQLGGTAGVRYFIVDCRPAEQYNSKHLYTAFHLDANLLLQDPKEFSGTADALLTTQKQAIEAALLIILSQLKKSERRGVDLGSSAGGEHLCFMGSGHEEEDKYVRMVVAYFLQRNTKYVSIAFGGYEILAKAIEDPSMITQAKQSPTRTPGLTATAVHDAIALGSTIKQNIVEKLPVINTQTASLINMISSAVKTKSIEVKDKVKDYIAHTSLTDPTQAVPKHVSKQDKVDKLYRQNKQASVFSLDGDDEDDEATISSKQNEGSELVDIESWFLRTDMLHKYECEHIDENNRTHPSLLLVSSTHLYILRKLPEHKTTANLVSRRPLESITKITSKKNFPEIITFRYATTHEEEEQEREEKNKSKANTTSKPKTKSPVDCDKVYLPDAGDATKNVKILIIKALNMFDDVPQPVSS